MSQLAFKIPYGSDLHKSVLEGVMARVKMAEHRNNNMQEDWDEAEKECRAYVPQTEARAREKAKQEAGKSEYAQIVLPYSTALLLSAYTYWSSVFLSRSPVFQFQANAGGPSGNNVLALEALMNYQLMKGAMKVPLHIWLMDVGKYGRAIVGNYWSVEVASIAEMVEQQVTVAGVPQPEQTKTVLERKRHTTYEGNRLYNIRPHDFLPDPRVSLPNLQKGEFCGVKIREVGWNHVLKMQAAGIYFNIGELKKVLLERRDQPQGGSPNVQWPSSDDAELTWMPKGAGQNCELIEMYVEIVPKIWSIDAGTYPEKWVFTIANRRVIVGARPLGCKHNMFPFSCLEYEVDGYTLSSRGIMQLLSPLNYALSWLLNSHFHNVRAALNGTVIVDPSRMNMNDLSKKTPGRIWRIAPSAYGTDARTVAYPLAIPDVTRGHLGEMQGVVDIMQRVIGVNDAVMGMMQQGGRKTATEVRTSSTFGINRLKTDSEYFSAMGWEPLSKMLLENSQQYFNAEMKLRIAGDQAQADGFVNVNPDALAGDYSYMPVDGTLPIDRFAQATLWKEMLQGMLQDPNIATQYDVAGIFAWIAQLAGLKNISNFKVQVQPPGAPMPNNVTPLPQTIQTSAGSQASPPVGNVGFVGRPA